MANSSGQKTRIIVVHDPAGATIASAPSASAASSAVERRAGDACGVLGETGVPGRLAAARLAERTGHLAAGGFEHLDGGVADVGFEHVDQAGDQQGDPHRHHHAIIGDA